jgi:hypothetical protein
LNRRADIAVARWKWKSGTNSSVIFAGATTMNDLQFSLGDLTVTPGAQEAIANAGQDYLDFLDRHQKGDWGNLSASDKEENDKAVIHGDRIFSAYRTQKGKKLWIITEADRSSTCILLPEEH